MLPAHFFYKCLIFGFLESSRLWRHFASDANLSDSTLISIVLALYFCNKKHTLKILARKARSSQIPHNGRTALANICIWLVRYMVSNLLPYVSDMLAAHFFYKCLIFGFSESSRLWRHFASDAILSDSTLISIVLAMYFCNKKHTLKILARKARSSQILHERQATLAKHVHTYGKIYGV